MEKNNKKRKIKYAVLALFFLVVGVALVAFSYNPTEYGVETSSSWTWDLEAGWNAIVFAQVQINACSSDNPVDVLTSIDSYWDFIFDHNAPSNNYWYNQPNPNSNGGPLQHLNADTDYDLHVIQDCTLVIEKSPPDITISSTNWVVAVSGFFMILSGMLAGIKAIVIKI